jgi:hypothetical protein
MSSDKMKEIEKRLEALDRERHALIAELTKLRASRIREKDLPPLLGIQALQGTPKDPDQKVSLFLRLFRCRESVFPKLWVNRAKNSKGYSPACRNEWVRSICGKPQVKCSDCPNQAFPKLDASAVRDHLQGKHTIGTYAIREDDTCTFLAADFDGDGWAQDIIAYRNSARELGVQVEIERSRSGNGAHAWIFFSEPIPARLARQLGTIFVGRAIANRHSISLETYDRFFPNQDFLPKGGFGNLIALPLQKTPRENGNSVFLREDLTPAEDQWELLSRARLISLNEVRSLLNHHLGQNSFSLIQYEDESVALAEKALDSGNEKIIAGSFPGQIEIDAGAQLSINLEGLPSSILSAFKRTATFANPKFFELERLRFSTWKTPRFIFCGEVRPDRLILPRGSLDACLGIAKKAGSNVILKDTKPAFKKLKLAFSGELSTTQKKAVSEMLKSDIGVLVAPPGAGKTVMGCALISERKVSTLILVHRMPLLEQWRERLVGFLGLNPKNIGVLGGQKKKQSGEVDIGMLQTFSKLENPEVILSKYGQIIIDECHHIPAVSFEAVLKKSPARHVVGLTATPYRKDGHQSIIHMQCGPTRYEIKEVDGPRLKKRALIRESSFKMPEDSGPQPPIHTVWEQLVADPDRLDLVAKDLYSTIKAGRFPLIISERKEHLSLLADAFEKKLHNLPTKGFTLTGGLGKKARTAILEEIQSLIGTEKRPYVLATGSFIGEGFDLPELDTLIIAMPVSFKGKLIQYAGRLHRASS